MIVRLDSLEDSRLDVFARLTDVQLRSRLEPEKAVLIAESAKVAERALEAGLEPLSLLVEEKWLRPAADKDGWDIEARRSHQKAGDVFVAVRDHNERVKPMRHCHGFG